MCKYVKKLSQVCDRANTDSKSVPRQEIRQWAKIFCSPQKPQKADKPHQHQTRNQDSHSGNKNSLPMLLITVVIVAFSIVPRHKVSLVINVIVILTVCGGGVGCSGPGKGRLPPMLFCLVPEKIVSEFESLEAAWVATYVRGLRDDKARSVRMVGGIPPRARQMLRPSGSGPGWFPVGLVGPITAHFFPLDFVVWVGRNIVKILLHPCIKLLLIVIIKRYGTSFILTRLVTLRGSLLLPRSFLRSRIGEWILRFLFCLAWFEFDICGCLLLPSLLFWRTTLRKFTEVIGCADRLILYMKSWVKNY